MFRPAGEVFPVYAHGHFVVCRDGVIHQTVVFDYYDPLHIYSQLAQDEEGLGEELDRLSENMQSYLDEERVYINGVRVRPRVKFVDLVFRGTAVRPSIIFMITFRGRLRRREVNVYEDYYGEETLEYDYEVYWVFPERARIVEVDVDSEHEVVRNRLVIWGRKGSRVRGYEAIRFLI